MIFVSTCTSANINGMNHPFDTQIQVYTNKDP